MPHGGEQDARWREAGIPDGYTASQLLYNPIAETLILELKGLAKGLYPKRLLVRHRTAERYEQIGNPAEEISYESPARSERQPLVVFSSKKLHKSSAGDYRSADWDAAYIFNLQSKELSVCVSKDSFVVPPLYDERGWISEVLGLSDDGSWAYVIAGLGKRQDNGGKAEVHYDYHVAKLNLNTKRLKLISHLKNPRF